MTMMWDLCLTIYCRGSRNFSSCSAEDFEKLTLNKGGSCLLNIPKPDEAYSAPSCGNKLVDPGEECDCGTPKVSQVFRRRLWALVVDQMALALVLQTSFQDWSAPGRLAHDAVISRKPCGPLLLIHLLSLCSCWIICYWRYTIVQFLCMFTIVALLVRTYCWAGFIY